MSLSAVQLREYEQLFTGTNQQGGYDHPFLSYRSNITDFILKQDNVTYFHYPNIAPVLPLSACGLIESGATAGSIPYKADRIWKKLADYKNYSVWGDSSSPNPGVWLCSWLSAGYPGQDPVWKDRWFDPGLIGFDMAFHQNTPAVWDTDSRMTMEPGVWYKYFHYGDITNSNVVSSLSGNAELLLDVWTYPITYDASPNEISTTFFGSNPIQNTSVNFKKEDDNSLGLNGIDQHALVAYSDSYNLSGDISVSTWVYNNDWNNTKGNEILSKSFRGGWSIGVNNGFFNPLFATFNAAGSGVLINSDGRVYKTASLIYPSIPVGSITDSEYFTWVLDNSKKRLYKINLDGNIDNEIVFESWTDLTSITMDSKEYVFVIDTVSNIASGFNTYMDLVSTIPGVLGSKITFDLNNDIQSTNYTDICIDNDNHKWEVLPTGGLRKDSAIDIYTGTFIGNAIVCDHNNGIWVTFDTNSYLKLRADTFVIETSGTIGNDDINPLGMDLTREYYDGSLQDFIWFAHQGDHSIYKCNTLGEIQKTINLAPFDVVPSLKHFTSYDWNRKFNYIPNNKQSQLQLKCYFNQVPKVVYKRSTLTFPTSGLVTNDWHLLSFTYKQSTGKLSFYVDTVLRETDTVPNCTIFYEYETPLYIGSNAGKIESLDKEINSSAHHFKGSIDDVRIYSQVLEYFEFWNIYMMKYNFQDMTWRMPTDDQEYMEEIERFHKFKLPGSKSQFYNLRLMGLKIEDPNVKKIIEDILKETVKKVAPAHTELFEIKWDE